MKRRNFLKAMGIGASAVSVGMAIDKADKPSKTVYCRGGYIQGKQAELLIIDDPVYTFTTKSTISKNWEKMIKEAAKIAERNAEQREKKMPYNPVNKHFPVTISGPDGKPLYAGEMYINRAWRSLDNIPMITYTVEAV